MPKTEPTLLECAQKLVERIAETGTSLTWGQPLAALKAAIERERVKLSEPEELYDYWADDQPADLREEFDV